MPCLTSLSKPSVETPGKALEAATTLHPLAKKIEKSEFERPIGGKTVARDAKALADGAETGTVDFELAEILFSGGVRINE